MEKLNQVVYVVTDKKAEKIIGAFNELSDAEDAAIDYELPGYIGGEISITPVLVDSVNDDEMARRFWLTRPQVEDATQNEIDLALVLEGEEAEDDEDEDEDAVEDVIEEDDEGEKEDGEDDDEVIFEAWEDDPDDEDDGDEDEEEAEPSAPTVIPIPIPGLGIVFLVGE